MKSPEPKGPHQRHIIHQSNRVGINLHNLQQVVAAAKGAVRVQKRESPIAREMQERGFEMRDFAMMPKSIEEDPTFRRKLAGQKVSPPQQERLYLNLLENDGEAKFPPPSFINEAQVKFDDFGAGMSSIGEDQEDMNDFVKELNGAGPADKK